MVIREMRAKSIFAGCSMAYVAEATVEVRQDAAPVHVTIQAYDGDVEYTTSHESVYDFLTGAVEEPAKLDFSAETLKEAKASEYGRVFSLLSGVMNRMAKGDAE